MFEYILLSSIVLDGFVQLGANVNILAYWRYTDLSNDNIQKVKYCKSLTTYWYVCLQLLYQGVRPL